MKNIANYSTNDLSTQTKIALILALLFLGLFQSLGLAADFSSSDPLNTQQTTQSIDTAAASQAVNPLPQPQDFLDESSPLSSPTIELKPEASVDKNRQCSSSGDAEQGSQSCIQSHPKGKTEIKSDWEVFGNEKKEQTITSHYNSNGEPIAENDFRVKTHYRASDLKEKEFELFDIVNQPAKGLITRDLIIKQFDSKGFVKKVTWAHYVEIGDSEAGLQHHAVLYYQNGKLTSGYADQYKNGKVVDTLLNYDPKNNPNLKLEKASILKWSSTIDRLIQTSSAVI